MAGEILFSGLSDQRLTEVLSSELLMMLADRAALPNHPALMWAGDAAASGSATLKIPAVGLGGYSLLASTGEGSAVANTALPDASYTVTVARYCKAYEGSDLARITNPATGAINPAAFAQDAIASQANTLTSLIANITDDFTAYVGSSGVDLTIANFNAAIQTLEVAKVPGPYLCFLHPQQYGDLRAALIASNASGALLPASQAQMAMVGNGIKGELFGVQIFSTSHVPTANAGADYAGGMFGRGAVLWADASIPNEGDPNMMIIGGKLLLERQRTAKSALTAYVTTSYMGVSTGINAAGCSLITDF